MAKICNVCWNEIPDNDEVCKICGARVEAAPTTQQAAPVVNYSTTAPATPTDYQAAPAVNYNAAAQQPVYTYVTQVKTEPADPPAGLSVGAFFGLNILFNIPFIGFIFTIVMAFAPRNKTLKNFARSYLIWYIIGAAVLATILIFVILIAGESVDIFEEIFEELFYVIEDII